eukprot:SAG11_NODE_4361_length_1933_cov_1.818975_2_plen_282_part_00
MLLVAATLLLQAVRASGTDGAGLHITTFPNTALAGATSRNGTLPSLSSLTLPALSSAVLEGELTLSHEWAIFGLRAQRGFARLWVDDHLMLDTELAGSVPPAPSPSPSPIAKCAAPGGDRSALAGYSKWVGANLPTSGTNDPHSMRTATPSGDCAHGCSLAVCAALCEKLEPQGCVGFVANRANWDVCFMRKLSLQGDSCAAQLSSRSQADVKFTSYTREVAANCNTSSTFCPPGGGHAPPPMPPPTPKGVAAYAIPVPFLPGRSFAKIRIEITTAGAPGA